MSIYLIYTLGFLSQGLFGLRIVIQWIQSEKEGRVVSPPIFWQVSLVASWLFLAYGILRVDIVIILGQLLSSFIYTRNLTYLHAWKTYSIIFRSLIQFFPLTIVILWLLLANTNEFIGILSYNAISEPFTIIGVTGQLLLNLRFVYQWYYIEKLKSSVFGKGFWVISLAGSILVITYALFRLDPVLLLAQFLGLFVYARNILLSKKGQN